MVSETVAWPGFVLLRSSFDPLKNRALSSKTGSFRDVPLCFVFWVWRCRKKASGS